jgi:4-amino-4-deoxy-L-arabinose transferase-like glycosyltransferase
LDTLACLFLFYITHHFFNEKAAFTTFSLALFCPITAVYTNVVNPESLTLFFMILSLFLVSQSTGSDKSWIFFAAGISTILMGYCRQEFSPFILIFAVFLFINQMKKEKILKNMSLYFLGVLIIMTPWITRNYNLTGRFIPFSSGGGLGLTLYFGTLGEITDDESSLEKFFKDNPEIEKKYNKWYQTVLFDRTTIEEKIQYDQTFMNMALDNIKNNPYGYILTSFKRIHRVWINLHADEFTFLNTQKLRLFHPDFQKIKYYIKEDPKEIFILIAKYILFSMNIIYLLMAAIGLWICRKKIVQLSFMIIPLIYAQIFFLFIHSSKNYTIPYWPCIIFFGGIGFYYSFLSKINPQNELSCNV